MTELVTVAEDAVKLAMKKGFDEVEVFCSKIVRQDAIPTQDRDYQDKHCCRPQH